MLTKENFCETFEMQEIWEIIEFFTKYMRMPILAFSSLLLETKKSGDKMLPLVGIEPRQLLILSPTILSTLT